MAKIRIGWSLLVVIFFLTNCDKEVWFYEYERSNSLDVRLNEPCDVNACESKSDFDFKVYLISPSSPAKWENGPGYRGYGLVLTGNTYGGEVGWQYFSDKVFKVTFWTRAGALDGRNILPIMKVNGEVSELEIIEGDLTAGNWMHVESELLESGQKYFEIVFPRQNTYSDYFIDEIEYFCR